MLPPDDAEVVVRNLARHSVGTRLRAVLGEGTCLFEHPRKCDELDQYASPPTRLYDSLVRDYADCLMGKGHVSRWVSERGEIDLPFGRPSIRITGGEFYTWPHRLHERTTAEDERLAMQKRLLDSIRSALPEYDIFVLTNGRFAVSQETAERVVGAWAGNVTPEGGRTRICISVDVFHRPPPASTVEEMLSRIWKGCRKAGLGAPYLYGIPNRRIVLTGRALTCFARCDAEKEPEAANVSGSSLYPSDRLMLDPVDLVHEQGCPEMKGLFFETPLGALLLNNVVVSPAGRLAYCCACVGDYGDFVNEPNACLRNMLTDPVSLMLRQTHTTIDLLRTAVEIDPSIKVLGSGYNAPVTGSTCYQLLSGTRVRPTA